MSILATLVAAALFTKQAADTHFTDGLTEREDYNTSCDLPTEGEDSSADDGLESFQAVLGQIPTFFISFAINQKSFYIFVAMETEFKVNPAPSAPPPPLPPSSFLPDPPFASGYLSHAQPSWLPPPALFPNKKTKDNVLKWDRVNHLSSLFILAMECWVGFVGSYYIEDGVTKFAFWDVTTESWMSRCMLASFYLNVLLTYPATFLVMRDQVMGVFMPHARFDPYEAASAASSPSFKTISTTHHATTADPEYVAMIDDDATSSVRQSTPSASRSKPTRPPAEPRTRLPAWFCWIHPQDTRRHTILLTLMLQALVCTFSLVLEPYPTNLFSTRSLFSLVFALYILACKMCMNVRGEHVGLDPCDRSSEPSISLQSCKPSLRAIFIPYNNDDILCYRTAAGAYTQDIVLATVIFVLVIGYFLELSKKKYIVAVGLGSILMVVFIVSMYFLCTNPFAKIVERRYGSYSDFLRNPSISSNWISSQEIPLMKRKDITIPFDELKFEAIIAKGGFGVVSKYRYFGKIVAVKQVGLFFCLFACHICQKLAN